MTATNSSMGFTVLIIASIRELSVQMVQTRVLTENALTNKFAFENAVYIDVNQQLTSVWHLSYGVRLSSFLRLGQDKLNVYENDKAVGFNSDLQLYEKIDPIGSESGSQGKVEKSFMNLEPRLALSYQLNDDTSLKASYNRMTQYLHLLSNTSSPAPLDVWTPSGKFIQPQILDQIAVGYFKNYELYSLEVESFYKTIKNRIDYIDGANLIANDAIEQVLLNGRSRAYGLELLFRKNKGRFKGWFAYTLSKSEQQTRDETLLSQGSITEIGTTRPMIKHTTFLSHRPMI